MAKVVLRDTQMIMPTTAKLFGALGLAATGFFGSELMLPYLPPGTQIHGLAMAAGSFGLLLGWRVIGMHPGRGMLRALQRGVNAAVYLVVSTLAFLGALQMIRMMVLGRYDGPMDAVVDILAQGLRLGADVMRPDVIGVLFCGSLVSAMLSEWAWKRWQ
jgi:hypothetical protein